MLSTAILLKMHQDCENWGKKLQKSNQKMTSQCYQNPRIICVDIGDAGKHTENNNSILREILTSSSVGESY